MKQYPATAIRNVAVAGHNGVGKTTLVSALLHEAGAVNRFGRVEDGSAPTDFDPEEIERKISIGLAVAALEWKKHKVNLLDTPGYGIFASEMICAMRAADAALLVVDAVAGVEVQTEKAWSVADEFGLPRMVVVNRMDRENADGGRVMDQLQKKFGRSCVCIEAPIGKEKGFRGTIDLIGMKGFLTDDSGKTAEGPIPEEFAADAATLLARSFKLPTERAEVWARYLATAPPRPYFERALLERAEALLDAGRTAEAKRILDELRRGRSLTEAQQRQLDRLLLKAKDSR